MSFGHKAVNSALSKLNIESKNLFYKSCSVWYAFWECGIKSEISKKVILSLSELNMKWEDFFLQKLLRLVCLLRMSNKKWMLSSHLWHYYIYSLLSDGWYLLLAICDLLYVTCYLNLFIWSLLLLAKTCSFRSLLYVS